jgi:hypothetical protein
MVTCTVAAAPHAPQASRRARVGPKGFVLAVRAMLGARFPRAPARGCGRLRAPPGPSLRAAREPERGRGGEALRGGLGIKAGRQ